METPKFWYSRPNVKQLGKSLLVNWIPK